MAQTADRVRDFLIEEAHWQGSRAELTDELPLIENMVIDSMALLRLVAWLEAEFGIAIADSEVVPSNFGTIFKIATTGAFRPLYAFDGTSGSTPFSGLTLASDGNFYGTASFGGSGNNGVLFKIQRRLYRATRIRRRLRWCCSCGTYHHGL